MDMKNNRQGFTIIELLVVISVITILIGIAIPRFKGMQDAANIAKAKAELKTLQTAIESVYINSTPHNYPGGTGTICASVLNTASPLIVSTPLYDPFRTNGTEYDYGTSNDGKYYVVWSYGPDGIKDITGIDNDGLLLGDDGDDIFVTNGSGEFL
jgi:prepilin-type N-terminal cleavage/methylation domain-containing protein